MFTYIESSEDYVSIYSDKKLAELVLNFYLSLQDQITTKNYHSVGNIFENSFRRYLTRYLGHGSISYIDNAFRIVNDSLRKYTDNGIIVTHYGKDLLECLAESLEFSDLNDINDVSRIMIFYRSYLENIKKLSDVDSREIALEVDVIPMRYLYLVYNKNPQLKEIDKKSVEIIKQHLFELDYNKLDSLPFRREYFIWLLLGSSDINFANNVFDDLVETMEKNQSRYFSPPSSNVLSTLIFVYQLIYINDITLLRSNLMKDRALKFLEINHNVNSFLFNLMYVKNEISEFNTEIIGDLMSRWEFQAYKETGLRDYYVDKSIAEFVLLVLVNSNMSTKSIAEILLKLKIPGYTLDRQMQLGQIELNKSKIINFQQIFLKIDERSVDEILLKVSDVISIVLKEEYLNRHLTPILSVQESEFKSKNLPYLSEALSKSVECMNGDVSSSNSEYSFEKHIIDDLDNLGWIFKDYWINYLVNQFLFEVTKTRIYPHVHKRSIKDNKETSISEILKHIRNVHVHTDTVIGYRDYFYDYKDVNKYTDFLQKVKNKINIENSGHIIFAIDSSLVKIGFDSVKIEVHKIKIDDYVKANRINMSEDGSYQINIGQEKKIKLTQDEMLSFVDRRIRKVIIIVKYRVIISKERIGNFIEFKK